MKAMPKFNSYEFLQAQWWSQHVWGTGYRASLAMNSFTMSAYFKSCLKTRTGEKTFMPMGSILARAELPKARFHTISESLDDFSIDLVETKYIVLNGEATLPTRKRYFFNLNSHFQQSKLTFWVKKVASELSDGYGALFNVSYCHLWQIKLSQLTEKE